MSTVAANVNVAITGAVYASEAGSTITAPTTATSVLDTDLQEMGYISEDGITESYNDSTSEIKAWQGGAIVREVISGSKATFEFEMIENKRETAELYHKGSVVESDGATGWKMDIMTPAADPRSFNFDVLDGSDHIRIFVELGEVTERSDITYKSDDKIGYHVKVTAYPVNGVVATKFTDKSSWATA